MHIQAFCTKKDGPSFYLGRLDFFNSFVGITQIRFNGFILRLIKSHPFKKIYIDNIMISFLFGFFLKKLKALRYRL